MTAQIQIGEPEQAPELASFTLGDMGPQGDTLAYLDGEQISVFGGIPGEEVVARVLRYRPRRRRNRRVWAVVEEVLEASPHRVAPPCPYFGPCTGCQWQHIEYAHQLELKREAVERELRRFRELAEVPVSDTMPSEQVYGYRNHARFTVRRHGYLGYVNRSTRSFVEIDECMLMSPWINETLQKLQGRCEETSQLSVRYGVATGDWLVQPTLTSKQVPIPTGQTHYREELLGKVFRIASPSFFQVNTRQAEKLALLVRERLALDGTETLIDAYAGVATFAVLLAPYVERVIAIEESAAAVKDAAINTLGVSNLEFRQGKTEEVLQTLGERPDAVILDPPRAGCDPAALAAIVEWAPRRVAYVSCEPKTLARDLHILVQGGLRVETVEPVDMFPQTYHVECLATLSSTSEAASPEVR